MNSTELLRLAERVLSLPTAPYHEYAVRAFIEAHCRGLGLRVERDAAGNVFARYGRATPLVIVAHMDHPGFEALGPNRARFLGGVPNEMFQPGIRVRFQSIRARIRRRIGEKRVLLTGAENLRRDDFGGWDLPLFRLRSDQIHAAQIDDLLGVVTILATLTEVVRRRLRTSLWGVFTRAEEVGFPGAIEVARSGRIPHKSLVISLETSKERPWAQIGDGPVIRVGDRMTMFDPSASWFLTETARRAKIRAQRCLMDGGSCEATAFAAHGYRTGGLCLPLGNYHNIGPGKRPAAEFVSVSDFEGLVALTVEVARRWPRFGEITGDLRKRVDRIYRSAPRKLSDK
jgi:endoglucanase